MRAVVLIGPPGSGKSYLGQMFKERLDFYHLDTGELIKRIISDKENDNNKIIQEQKELYLSGQLVGEKWVAQLVSEEIKITQGRNIVFSGSPRTMIEAKIIVPFLIKNYGKENISAFLLKVNKEISIERMRKRRVCSNCGISLMPDEDDKKCHKCGGPIVLKILDNEDKINIRFKEYEERTKPIIDYFRNLNLLKEINAELSPEEVFINLKNILAFHG